jgi:hypothetical protein
MKEWSPNHHEYAASSRRVLTRSQRRVEIASGCSANERLLRSRWNRQSAERWPRALLCASPERALRVAVHAARDALRRNSCTHEQALDESHRFCRRCGVALADAALWRWSA